jgi:hypothetical protein
MKRSKLFPVSIVTIAIVLVAMAALIAAAAQASSPRFGTWKLNLSKSNMTLPPMSLTRTDEPTEQGGVKVTYEGIEADGSRIAYSYTAKYDGKEYRPSGVGMANGWETIALKRLDDYSYEATLKRGGKVVSSVKVVISKDGMTMTQFVNSTNGAGQPTHSVSIWEKH